MKSRPVLQGSCIRFVNILRKIKSKKWPLEAWSAFKDLQWWHRKLNNGTNMLVAVNPTSFFESVKVNPLSANQL